MGKKKAKKSEMEVEKQARNEAIRQMAEKELDENLDLVKMLNCLGSRATAFTIRDSQLAEKGKRAGIEKDYNDRMDKLMEIDRLRDLAKREEDENVRRGKRIEDRQVIIEQIQAREKQQEYLDSKTLVRHEKDHMEMLGKQAGSVRLYYPLQQTNWYT